MSPFETHKPVLEYALLKQGRSVLEVGCGEASTPLIVSLSKVSLTLENNWEWVNRILKYEGDNHRILFEPDLVGYVRMQKRTEADISNLFSLALVDNDNWKERCQIVTLLKGIAEVILLHDSFDEHLHRCTECGFSIPSFAYRLNLYPSLPPNPNQPPTLILSDTVDVTKWEVPGLTRG